MKKFESKTTLVWVGVLLVSVLGAMPAGASEPDGAFEGGGVITGSGGGRLKKNDTECAQCPVAPVPANRITFEKAEKFFSQTEETNPNSLEGRWIMVFLAKNPMTKQTDSFDRHWEEYRPDGIRNASDGMLAELNFRSEVSDWTHESAQNVKLEAPGLFYHSQGPFEVAYQGGSACFAHYSERRSGGSIELNYSAFLSYACRIVQGNSNQMVCAVSPTGKWPYESQTPWLGRVVEYLGYVKAPK